jgi:hypothetical protein
LLATQRGRTRLAQGRPALRLLRAPQGVAVAAHAAPVRAFAGAFHQLVASGSARAGAVAATSRYRFTARAIDARWTVGGMPRAARAEVLFPSWGRGAHATVRLRDGRSLRLGRRPIALRRVARIEIASVRGGYRVMALSAPAGARVWLAPTRPQSSAPTPGPTVVVGIGPQSGGTACFGATLVPWITPRG